MRVPLFRRIVGIALMILIYDRPASAVGSNPLRVWLDKDTGRVHAAGKNLDRDPSPAITADGIAAKNSVGRDRGDWIVELPEAATEEEIVAVASSLWVNR